MPRSMLIRDQAAADWEKVRLPRWFSWLGQAAFALFVGWLLWSTYSEAWQFDHAAPREQSAMALVTAHTDNHNQFRYEFAVGGTKYDAWGNVKSGKLQIGERVTVFYYAADPGTNALEHLSSVAQARFGMAVVMTIWALVFGYFILHASKNSKVQGGQLPSEPKATV